MSASPTNATNATAAPAAPAAASTGGGAAMMNPNMRKMMSKSSISSDTKPTAAAAEKQKESGGSAKPKAAAPGATAVGGATGATTSAEVTVNPKNIVRHVKVHFEYNPSDSEHFPRVRGFEKLIKDEFKGKATVTSEPASDTFQILVNKQIWFSKKTAKNFPDDRSLLRALQHYLDTGDKTEILAADGAGCVIA